MADRHRLPRPSFNSETAIDLANTINNASIQPQRKYQIYMFQQQQYPNKRSTPSGYKVRIMVRKSMPNTFCGQNEQHYGTHMSQHIE